MYNFNQLYTFDFVDENPVIRYSYKIAGQNGTDNRDFDEKIKNRAKWYIEK